MQSINQEIRPLESYWYRVQNLLGLKNHFYPPMVARGPAKGLQAWAEVTATISKEGGISRLLGPFEEATRTQVNTGDFLLAHRQLPLITFWGAIPCLIN